MAPLLCPFEKVYSYGKGWMLDDAALRTKAHAAWPRFIVPDDLCDEGKAEDKAEESGGGEACSVIRAGSARHSARRWRKVSEHYLSCGSNVSGGGTGVTNGCGDGHRGLNKSVSTWFHQD